MRHRGFAAVFGRPCVFLDNICGWLQYNIIIHSPSCLTGSIFWFCHVYIPRRTKDASIRLALSLRVYNTFVLLIQRLLWSLWLERNYFGDFWVRVPRFVAVFHSHGARVFYFLTMPLITLNPALWERTHSHRSCRGRRSLSTNIVLVLTMPRISAAHRAPQFVGWRSISVLLNNIPR